MIPITDELALYISEHLPVGYYGPDSAVIGDAEFIIYFDDDDNAFLAHRSEFEFTGIVVELKEKK